MSERDSSNPPDGSEAPTRVSAGFTAPRAGTATGLGRLASSTGSSSGRFLPGDMVAGRYRVVGLLGQGGMGEVYRADDLTLGQPVALKFLPRALERDEDRLQRFLHEVRIARQVSHRNVCRVYDIGEVDGSHYLSMEFVDGEDLATLLRRIGRLPEDKAVDIARQLCAGLAAAHDRGIVHRDLKPANVMLDRDGQVCITDFGLAGLAETIEGVEIRAGTPDYMAPEQLEGREVSLRSDLYSLGLVLYELFTGRRAFEARSVGELRHLRQTSTPTRPSEVVRGLDPAVERVIEQCLATDPELRPASALAVSAALPGGDPLAAALARGDTPSPDLVAAAGAQDGVRPVWALLGVLATAALLIAPILFARDVLTIQAFHGMKAPAELERDADEFLDAAGYTAEPVDRAASYGMSGDYLRWVLRERSGVHGRWDDLGQVRPSPFLYWSRRSPRPLIPAGAMGFVGTGNPPLTLSGETLVRLDGQGRLLEFDAVPPQYDDDLGPSPAVDWAVPLRAAGFDPSALQPTPSTWVPPVETDERAAWIAPAGDAVGLHELRIEAGAYRGRPVFFRLIAPWTEKDRMEAVPTPSGVRVILVALVVLLILVLTVAVLMARRNLRLGRGDRRGAFRLGAVVMGASLVLWVCLAHHVAAMAEVAYVLLGGVARGLLFGGIVWVVYLALEPYVRKLWPQLVIGWTRLLAGRFRDPLVGRDVLVGCVTGGVLLQLVVVLQLLPGWLGRAEPAPQTFAMWALNDFVGGIATLATFAMNGVGLPLMFLLVVMVARFLTRNNWIAVMVPAALMGLLQAAGVGLAGSPELIVPYLLFWFVLFVVLKRFGFLAFVVAFLIANSFYGFPIDADPSVHYAASAWLFPLVIVGLAIHGALAAMAGRPILRDPFAD